MWTNVTIYKYKIIMHPRQKKIQELEEIYSVYKEHGEK